MKKRTANMLNLVLFNYATKFIFIFLFSALTFLGFAAKVTFFG